MAGRMRRMLGKLPGLGQRTQKQAQSGTTDILGLWMGPFGLGPPEPGTFDTYRRMLAYPTNAFARLMATAPMRIADWSVEADDDVPEDVAMFIENMILPQRQRIIDQAIRALDYGFQAWELVWSIVDREGEAIQGQEATASALWTIDKLKPLLPDHSKPLVTEQGTFAGMTNRDIPLPPMHCLWYVHDMEADDYYGRSILENQRTTTWTELKQLRDHRMKYAGRVGVPSTLCHYPPGEMKDAAGNTIDAFEGAKRLLVHIAAGRDVAIPNDFMTDAADLAQRGMDMDKLRKWQFDFLEAKVSHGAEFSDWLRHCDSLIMRAWLVPERAGIEGQYGTKAEADEHGGVALTGCELNNREFLQYLNAYVVNRMVVVNFGERYKDSVRITAKPLDDDTAEMFTRIVENMLSSHPDYAEAWVDIDQMFERVGIPLQPKEERKEVEERQREEELLKEAERIAQQSKQANEGTPSIPAGSSEDGQVGD